MTITRRGVIAAAAGGALLAGCATAALAPQGQYKAGNAFTVTLGRPWSDLTNTLSPRPPGVRMLSLDGPLLNRLYLAGVEPGGSLWRPRDRDTPRATYRADMSDTELVEFVIDCVAVEYQAPESSALRPQALAGAPGVRFDISARTAAGLNMSGTALVGRAGDRLNVLLFLAPSEHYYAALLPEVETLFASART
jgi:hypothetical protein